MIIKLLLRKRSVKISLLAPHHRGETFDIDMIETVYVVAVLCILLASCRKSDLLLAMYIRSQMQVGRTNIGKFVQFLKVRF